MQNSFDLSTRRDRILAEAIRLVARFVYYDRKEDKELPRGEIEAALRCGEISADDIVEAFIGELYAALGVKLPTSGGHFSTLNATIVRDDSPLGRIILERRRQIAEEHWTPEHDDEHEGGELALAAACYAVAAVGDPELIVGQKFEVRAYKDGVKDAWPWAEKWDKRGKHSQMRMLVIATALLTAEIERRVRAGESLDG